MKYCYQPWMPKPETMAIVATAQDIINEYTDAGYTLTLRQLYYQFVARDLIENSERSYKNLGNTITKARMAGMISWYAIEDRNRGHNSPYVHEDDDVLVTQLSGMIHFDMWARQPCYVEVWVEKEALGNVIERACEDHSVTHMACKGYLSASEAWRAGQRFQEKIYAGKECHLIHLGDHDPSGLDMTRDNRERVDLFSECPGDVEVTRIALNIDQVDRFRPPPNPTKIADSRAKEYLKRFGRTSWELDALEPRLIEELIQNEVCKYIDYEAWNETLEEQNETRDVLRRLCRRWPDIKKDLQSGGES